MARITLGINHQSPLIYCVRFSADDALLGINHQSPLIYWLDDATQEVSAGNQSPIPFDILP